MKLICKKLSLVFATLVMAFQLTAGVVFSSLPVSLPTVATIALVATLPITQTACSKDQMVAAGKDVLSVVQNQELQGFIRTLAPGLLSKFVALVPSANDLIAAFQSGDTSTGLALVNTIFPVIEEVAGALISLSPPAMAILGVANIALHFILNHAQTSTAAKASVKAAKRAGVASVQQAVDYGSQPTWGCNFVQDKRCAVLAH